MNNPTTVVGSQTHIRGNLEGDEDLSIIGRVDGNISLTKTLTVDPGGIIVADIQVRTAIISGTVMGNVTASELVHITEEGRVVGDLSAPRVVLVDGASFKGNIDMGDLESLRTESRPFPTKTPARAIAPRPAPEQRPARKVERKPAPRPAPPPKRVVHEPVKTASQPVEKLAKSPAETADQSMDKVPTTKRKRARTPSQPVAAAKAHSGKPPKKAPKPPTTAGKRTRARRK